MVLALFVLVYVVEEGGFNFETAGISILYVELRSKERFQNHTWL